VTPVQPDTLLAATSLEETWSSADTDDVVFLAPWCRRFTRREAWQPLGDVVVGDPWATPEELGAGIAHLHAVTERALTQLGAVLSAYHGEIWSHRETRILLGPWLLWYLPAQLDRWERLVRAVAEHPGLAAWGWPEADAVVPPDTVAAVELLKGDRYNLQLMTPMMRAIGIRVTEATDIADAERPGFVGSNSRLSFRRRIAEKIAGSAIAARHGNTVVMRSPHFPREVQVTLVRALKLGAMPAPTAPTIPPTAARPELRAKMPALDMGDGAFERHLAAALIADLPTCFLEGYADVRAASHAMGRCPAAVLSANAWYFEEAFKRWAADGAARGSVLLGVQHGGNYGIDAYTPSEDHETAITDRYYTWGWTRDDVAATTVPMPAPKLMGRTQLQADPEATGVLLVATSSSSYPFHLSAGPEFIERYLARQSAFLSAVAGEACGVVRVRPHRESLGWDLAERIEEEHPDVTVESWEVPFADSLASCRVFVCDHLSTTFAEALATGKPTVLFWDPRDTPVRASAEPVLDALRSVGILHDTPEAAALAVTEAYADVVGWWSDPARVAAVDAFCRHFALTEPDAIDRWEKELRAVLHREL
jgi:putative transferase (TIGR04331 family)